MKPQLHWSHISMFTKCAEQFRRRYIEGERIPPGSGAATGTGLHKAAELDLTRKMETGFLAPADEVADIARDSVAKSFESDEGILFTDEEEEIGVDAVRAAAIDDAVRCSSVHHNVFAPKVSPIAIERNFVLELNNFPFDLSGTIDCDEGGTIWDWKTAKQTPAATEADTSGQVTIYSLAKYKFDNVLPAVKLGYVVKNKTAKAVLQETTRQLEDFTALSRGLERMAHAIDKECFPFASWMSPRPWWCSPQYCGYYKTCEGVSNRAMVQKG